MKIYANAMCVTPFNVDGTIDFGAFASMADRIAANGLGMFVGGSSPGQGYTLTSQESEKLLSTAVEASRGRVRVMASGFEPRTAQGLIDFAEVVRASGADGMQVYSLDIGHGGRPSEAEIYAYFTTILSKINMPGVLSTHENMRYLVPHSVLRRLIDENENLVGIHANTNRPDYLREAVAVAKEGTRAVELHVGSTEGSLMALSYGANGFLSAEANLAPEICAELITAWKSSNVAALADSYRRLTALIPLMEFGTATRGIKSAMTLLGMKGSSLRAPLLPLSADEQKIVRASLTAAGLKTAESAQ